MSDRTAIRPTTRSSAEHAPRKGAGARTAKKYVREDEGFFPPDSVARKVWSYPTSALLGFIRAVTIEHLDPDLAASVDASGQVLQRPGLRYDRTVQYFATVLFGDARTVIRSSDVLMKIHARAHGHNPVTGGTFDSNRPSSQLWIHMTAWHSILYVYEKFGPGPLSDAEEERYWSECAIAAQFQPIEPESVPRSRADVRAYFEAWRPHLAASEAAQYNVAFILDGMRTIFTSLPAGMRAVSAPVIRAGVVATYPRWMRPMMGVRQSRMVDSSVTALLRLAMARLARDPVGQAKFLHAISPHGGPVLSPHLRGEQPESSRVWTAAEAREAFGDPRPPLLQYSDLLRAREGAGSSGGDSASSTVSGPASGTSVRPYTRGHLDPLLEFATPRAEG